MSVGDMSDRSITPSPAAPKDDERLRRVGRVSRLLNRPELGAVSGLALVFVFFAFAAGSSGMFSADGVMNWLTVSAQLGILAIGASLLMIAGEFDLSIGSMIGFAGMMIAIPAVFFGVPIWLCLIFAFAGALLVGFINGYIVIRTGLPSFIVSLAFLFILRGLTLALSILFSNRTIVGGLREKAAGDWLAPVFGGRIGLGFFQKLAEWKIIGAYPDGSPVVPGLPMVVVWWVVLALIGGDPHPRRQLDFRLGRRCKGGAQCWRASEWGENWPVHGYRLLRHGLCRLSGDGIRFGGRRPRFAEGIRSDYCGGHRR